MINPVNSFCSCDECGAKIGEECNDCLNHSSRLHYFIEKAPLINRIHAQDWTYSESPKHLKKLMLEEEDSLFLNEEEYTNWKSSDK
jgi:hypothetical protein